MKTFGHPVPKCPAAMIMILFAALLFLGCQQVEKPSKDASGEMKIVIEMDEAPESHTENITAEGEKLVNPYSAIPVVGKIFTTGRTGLDFWRAYHPSLVTGTENPALIADPEETCLDCHDQDTSCNNCHRYVGVRLVTAEE